MDIGSKEHYEILEGFEKVYKHLRLEREEKPLWKKGMIYQNGEANALHQAFMAGYSLGRIKYLY